MNRSLAMLALAEQLLTHSIVGRCRRHGNPNSNGFRGCPTPPQSDKGRTPLPGEHHGRTRRESGVIAGCCTDRRPLDT